MDQSVFEDLFERWKSRELKYQKNNKRKYLHFDKFIQFHKNIQVFKSYFKNSLDNVSKHGFYPLIKADIVSPRIKHEKNPLTGKTKVIKKKKIRPISYASHFDSFVYSWYSTVLTYFYEKKIFDLKIDSCVLAYLEKGKSNIHFAHEVFEFVKKLFSENGNCVALAFDLSSFFDGLDHSILKEKWCKILDITDGRLPKDHFAIYKSVTDYTFVIKEELETRFPIPVGKGFRMERICNPKQFREVIIKEGLLERNSNYNKICDSKKYGTKCGIPQGSPISACLSNIYMIDFDCLLNEEVKSRDAIYRRYCDDLIAICKTEDWEYFELLITNSIKEYQVVVNKEKTEKTFFKKNLKDEIRGYNKDGKYRNLQYLGFEFNGQNTYIRSSSMSRYSNRMSSKIDQAIHDAGDADFGQQDFIFRKKLLQRFTQRGSRNFITYAKRASDEIMRSKTVNNQVKNSVEKVERLIRAKTVEGKKQNQRAQKKQKKMKGKSIFSKGDANKIKKLIKLKLVSDSSTQKELRNEIRALGFYMTDFSNKKKYTVEDFEKYTTVED